MNKNQNKVPLLTALENHIKRNSLSFHVPGHKNGTIFPSIGLNSFRDILKVDLTEITGMDDLHHPEGVIKEAQDLTAELYKSDYSYFLVGGSTVGNMAMILSICQPGDKVIVQRNSHKSVMNALELAGAQPIFISPSFEKQTGRYSLIKAEQIKEAIRQNEGVKAIILTYPDYFGRTYDIKAIIDIAHNFHTPVLVDEAHGAHFTLGDPFPISSLDLGADLVVHSAHKMLPAMTMGSYLHLKSKFIDHYKLEHYLQMLQSSSPSYPIMASLDLARYFLANMTNGKVNVVVNEVNGIRTIFQQSSEWNTYSINDKLDDPLKIVLEINSEKKLREAVELLEKNNIFPELTTSNQILLIHGLGSYVDTNKLQESLLFIQKRLSSRHFDDKIEIPTLQYEAINALPFSYADMRGKEMEWVSWDNAKGKIAHEAITPYPPGIPLLIKGEEITEYHIEMVAALLKNGQHIHYNGRDIKSGITVLK